MRAMAPPTAMPAIAPVESCGAESELELGVVVGMELGRADVVEVVVLLLLDVVMDERDRSDDWKASWIMGANRLRLVTCALGSVVKPKLLLEPDSQETVARVRDLARMIQVWPLRLSQLNPVGQQPTKVSSAFIWYCTFHWDEWPAIAVHADV